MDDEAIWARADAIRDSGQTLTREEAERVGIFVPDGATGVTVYGIRVDLEAAAQQRAVTTHHALHWQQEAERLNVLVHALRRELEQVKQVSGRTVIQSLLTTLEHCQPFVRTSRGNFVKERVDGMLDELLSARAAALAALEHVLR